MKVRLRMHFFALNCIKIGNQDKVSFHENQMNTAFPKSIRNFRAKIDRLMIWDINKTTYLYI